MTYNQFFHDATGGRTPYAYQCRLACGSTATQEIPETLAAGAPCQSQLINIPTGLGAFYYALFSFTTICEDLNADRPLAWQTARNQQR